jgi:hypothetical protein
VPRHAAAIAELPASHPSTAPCSRRQFSPSFMASAREELGPSPTSCGRGKGRARPCRPWLPQAELARAAVHGCELPPRVELARMGVRPSAGAIGDRGEGRRPWGRRARGGGGDRREGGCRRGSSGHGRQRGVRRRRGGRKTVVGLQG